MHRHRTAQRRIVRGHTALLSAGVYHTAPFLQLYAYTPYSASCESCCYASVSHSAGLQSHGSMLRLRAAGMYENHIVPDCRHVGLYHTELCLQAYTVQCLSAGVCRTVLFLRACTIHRFCLQACTISYRAMSAGVYRAVLACLQVYAIQCYVPYIAHVCWCISYRTELCLQAYTVQCLSAGVCNTALCLRACTAHRACL